MATYNFLDEKGLGRLVANIKRLFASKSDLNEIALRLDTEELRAKNSESEILERVEAESLRLSNEEARALNAESDLASNLEAEISRAQSADLEIADIIQQEILRAKGAEATLSDLISAETERSLNAESSIIDSIKTEVGVETQRAIEAEASITESVQVSISKADEAILVVNTLSTDVSSFKSDIESGVGVVKNVLVNGTSVVGDGGVAYINLQSTTGGSTPIIVFGSLSQFPIADESIEDKSDPTKYPQISYLYLASDTYTIYQWNPDLKSYGEIGGNSIKVVENLPEVGEADILYIDGLYRIYQWVGDSFREIGGKDTDLRFEFNAHVGASNPHKITKELLGLGSVDNTSDIDKPISTAVQEALDGINSSMESFASKTDVYDLSVALEGKASNDDFRGHALNKENPHKVTAEILGLGSVDNTRDSDKPISIATQEALDLKVSIEDIKDSLTSTRTNAPLSARQGNVLNNSIDALKGDILRLGNVFHFKGTVGSYEELLTIENTEPGDCWQIRVILEDGSVDEELSGEMYSYTSDGGWIPISAAVMDISSYMATSDDSYNIIDSYEG